MISEDLIVPVALALVALLAIGLGAVVVAMRRDRLRAARELADTVAESAALRARVEELARRVEVRETPQEFVITGVGEESADESAPQIPERHIDGRLFVDIVLRESVVKAAALTHGVRRALSPENRNRIRFEMKREVKRSRKARRIEMRDVRRELAERKRAARQAAREAGAA